MTRLQLTRSAEGDISRAVLWYDRQRRGLGKFFLAELAQAFDRLTLFPEGYPAVRPGVRRMLISRFPYAVTYRPEAGSIVVIAVLHQSGDELRTVRRTEEP